MNRRSFIASVAFSLSFGGVALGRESDLRKVADSRHFRFGSAIDPEDLERPDAIALIKKNVNSVTPRNQLKWTGTEKQPGKFTFDKADAIVAFAKANRMKVYGHTLIWYRVPAWVDRIQESVAIKGAMTRHIQGVMSHFKGAIDTWDVVNEPFEYDSAVLRNSVFQRLLGEDHIGQSFVLAHEADPTATLVLNETHLEKQGVVYDEKRTAMLKLLERLVSAGTPIHAIGLQSHFRPGTDQFDGEATSKFCKALKEMGLGVYITELDASCRAIKRVKGFDVESYAKVFGDIISVAGESGDLRGATVWGLMEKYAAPEKRNSTNLACNKRINLYDENNDPRSSIQGIRNALERLSR